ncbi:MAG: nicotinate-nucleotide adenylyltransferase [Gammaproteobacteria bacterium]
MIGVFGGTFDPVHFGHLRSALEVRQHLGLHELRLVPCRVPPHRGEPVASVKQRVTMLKLAVDDQAGLILDQRELQREGPSYMVDTLESLRREVGEMPLCLIMGMDTFQGLPQWHHWTRLIEYAHVIVMTRPGWNISSEGGLGDFVRKRKVAEQRRLRDESAGYVYLYEVTQLEISASDIRRQLAIGHSPRYLLPDQVLEFIESEGIY